MPGVLEARYHNQIVLNDVQERGAVLQKSSSAIYFVLYAALLQAVHDTCGCWHRPLSQQDLVAAPCINETVKVKHAAAYPETSRAEELGASRACSRLGSAYTAVAQAFALTARLRDE